jgi:hypothetical protein
LGRYSKLKSGDVLADPKLEDLRLLAELCDDAVVRHGADIQKVERDVRDAISRLPLARQRTLRHSLSEFFKIQVALTSGDRPLTLN